MINPDRRLNDLDFQRDSFDPTKLLWEFIRRHPKLSRILACSLLTTMISACNVQPPTPKIESTPTVTPIANVEPSATPEIYPMPTNSFTLSGPTILEDYFYDVTLAGNKLTKGYFSDERPFVVLGFGKTEELKKLAADTSPGDDVHVEYTVAIWNSPEGPIYVLYQIDRVSNNDPNMKSLIWENWPENTN